MTISKPPIVEENKDSESKIDVWLKRLWAPISGFIGIVVTIVQFIQLWRGDRTTVSFVLAGVGVIAILASLFFIAFSKVNSPILHHRKILRYPRYSQAAKTSLVIFCFAIAVTLGILYWRDVQLQNKVIVLIADFDGPDIEKYHITDQFLIELNHSLGAQRDVTIVPLKAGITEQQGSNYAEKVGEQHRADLVIWGWYGVTNSDAKITVHLENLSGSKFITLPVSGSIANYHANVVEINSFRLQEQSSKEIAAIATFISGMISYENHDLEAAINAFNTVIESNAWANSLINKAFLYYYRGNAYFFTKNYRSALADYDKVLEFKPNMQLVLLNRGAAFANLGEYHKAIQDFSTFLANFPTYTDALFNRAVSYQATKQYNKALQDLDSLVEVIEKREGILITEEDLGISYYADFYDLAKTYFIYSRIFSDQNQEERAIDYLNKAIQKDPKYWEAFQRRGEILASQDKNELAASDFSRAIAIEPNDADSLINRCAVLSKMGRLDAALLDCDDAIQIDAKIPEAYNNRGYVFFLKEDYKNAILNYSKAINLSANHEVFYKNRGEAYQKSGQTKAALGDFTAAISVNPTYVEAYVNRGILYSQLGKKTDALDDFSQAIKLDPRNSRHYHNRAITYASIQDFDNALTDFAKAISLSPTYEYAYMGRARLYYSQGKFDDAIKDIGTALDINPNNTEMLLLRSGIYINLNEYSKALPDVNKIIDSRPEGEILANAYNNRCLIYTMQSNWKAAIKDCTDAIELNPEDPFAYLNRGIAFQGDKQVDQALDDYSKAIAFDPNYIKAYYNRGLIYQENGEKEKAIQDFQKVLEGSQDPTLRNMAEWYLKNLGVKP